MKDNVKLVGMKELDRALGELPKGARRRPALNALRAGGEVVARFARAIAPVDDGNLQESISVSTNLARSQRGDRYSLAPVEMYVGPGQHPQAITQEFGTWFHPAQPFMRPAWSATHLHALDHIGANLWVEIEKAGAREARKAAKLAKG